MAETRASSTTTKPKSSRRPASYDRCIVTFIDVLGFREIVANRQPDEVASIVAQLQKHMKSNAIPLQGRKKFVPSEHDFFTTQISDAVVRAIPFDPRGDLRPFFYETWSLALAQIELLKRGVLVRGGMTLGNVCIGRRKGDVVFGPALIRAYEIESSEAIYPRIVIDDALIQAASENETPSNNDHGDNLWRLTSEILRTAEDGTWYIDYIAVICRNSEANPNTFFKRHYELISENLLSQESLRTRRKYQWLQRYHNTWLREVHMRRVVDDGDDAMFDESDLYQYVCYMP